MMRTSNPGLNTKNFSGVSAAAPGEAMTIQGTVNRTAILLAILLMSSSWVWARAESGTLSPGIMWGGMLGGFVVAIITIFKKKWAQVTAPVYAVLQGLFIGGISAMFEQNYPGIVIQAVGLTFGTLAALLMLYTSRLIPVTQNFRMGVAAATGGIFLVYLVSFIFSFFGGSIPLIHESGLVGIGFSLFVVVIASLNLVLDFDFIERGAKGGLPRYMEWFAAFVLVVTLVWLYLEILRLLSKLRGHR